MSWFKGRSGDRLWRRSRNSIRRSHLSIETLETRHLLSVTTAVASGDWDSPSTWSAGVPDDTLRAVIPASRTVTLTGDDHLAKEIVVNGGVLAVAESPGVDKTLTSDWIHVNSGGVFQIGSQFNRYDANEFVVTLTGDDPTESFTVEGAGTITNNNGFLMAAGGGRLQFYGEEKLTFTKLAQTAEAGANQIVVEAFIDRDHNGSADINDRIVDWEVGDQIVIASSSRDYRDEEVRTITAATYQSDQTVLLTLDAPLGERHYGEIETYTRDGVRGDFNGDGVVNAIDYTLWRDHVGADTENKINGAGDGQNGIDAADHGVWADHFGGAAGPDTRTWDVDMRAEVALLNRNVRIEGLASQDTDNAFGDRARFNAGLSDGFGAHTMIMGSAGQITIDSVQFDRMGQTGRLGRYPIHWHLAGDRTGDVLRGASVTNSNNRGVTVHGTHNLLIENNVLHDIHGHGFFMEDGVETGNQFLSNIAFGIHKVGRTDAGGDSYPDVNDPFIVDTHDFVGQNPMRFLSSSAYWITNPDNTWVGNISAGVDGTGFWFILPEFAIGASADDPQYNGVNANETPLGLFDHNSSHSSHVGFNMDRGMDLESEVGATLLNNSFGRAYQPEDANGQQVMPVFSNFTATKHEIGVYHRGRYAEFNEFKFADNFTSTFITFSQSINDTIYVGHSRGNADLDDVVTGQSLYDGPNTMDGTHFAGFNRGDSAHVFRNHGGALRNTHVYVSNTSYEDDGTKEQLSISERDGTEYSASRDTFDFQAPTAIYDVDGTLTGHGGGVAGSVLLPDNQFLIDSGDVKPNGWDAWLSDDLYANFRIEFDGNNQGQLTLVAPDGESDTESSDDSHRTILKANNEIYTIAFPSGPASYGDGFEILYRIQLGNTNPASITESSIIRFQGVAGDVRVLESRNRFNGGQKTLTTQVATLAELETLSGPGYWVDGDDLVVKFVTVASESIRYFFTPGSNTPIDPGDGLVLSAVDDAYIQQTSTLNDTLLRVESSASRTRTSYLKFNVPETPDQDITGATLRLTVSGDAGSGMRIRVYEGGSDTWTETTLTTANAPAKTTLLDEITGDFVIGQTYVFDVSSAVVAGELVSFVIDSDGATSGGDAAFASSENGNAAIRPLLVVELADPPPVVLWEDMAPPASTDGAAVTALADPFGTGMGTIGQWVTNGRNQYDNINPGGPDLDVSAYDGMEYTFSFDYYVDSTQPLSDDTVYLNAGYGPSDWTTMNSGAVLDSWTTVTATGTIDTSQGSTINPLIIVNHKNTPSASPSFYIDNLLFSIESPASPALAQAPTVDPQPASDDASPRLADSLPVAFLRDEALLLDDRPSPLQEEAADEAFATLDGDDDKPPVAGDIDSLALSITL
ncbi:G8 domain protein [Planctomycetes bacterium MalM25]|nr:G8 domain protein [Planctomycetes bacterium MalM25]